MSRAVFFAVLALAAVASATVLWERTELPKEWTKIGAAPANLKHRFTIALPQRNMDKLAAMTLERADPDSVQYANWLEHSEIMDLIAPAPEVQARVVAWLRKNIRAGEAVEILELRDAVKVTGPASFASRVFRTKLALFKHDRTGMIVARQLGTYEIPAALARDIEMVTGMADFPPQRLTLKQMQPKDAGTNNACNVPYTMRNLYNISQTLVVDNAHVTQAPFAQYPGDSEGFGMPGLLQWIKLNLLPARAANVTIYGNKASVYTNASTGDAEAQLDIQMQTGMGQGAAQGFYIEDGWMYDFAVSVFLEGSGAPWVVSMSYGWPEENQCANSVLGDQCKAAGIPGWRAYLVRAENEWLKVTATGRTVIASSGDTGAPGDNNDCSLTQTYPFHPGYPATGSWLTSVGATTLVNTAESDYVYSPAEDAPPICSNKQCQCSTSTTEETCMNSDCSFTAGGGFSLFLPTPSWQSAQVAAYMASSAKKPSSTLFNSSKRGFPDIAAIGWDVFIVGPNQMIGGTSASCPIIAGLISQLNNWRFSQGLKAMGFFNPLLYKMAAAVPETVHDITTGSNECMEGTCCPGLGYSATTGWDPVVGWGTPNWGQWQHYVANLPYDKYVGARL